ncbi:glycosyltransferase family 2 protein [Pseudoflavonifractor phocaeensis]|uniref:glycosyltransferase family 2 protein n=1 Tax=Pseudoflavonifractor phocaeensis TaxID=1870988 RepID=UPI001F1A1136|nr:glycosyltransferase [Pseudoflavonifractor phocaeensis]MCF2661511.1 glycosyltransferase [Pseudoflavonifractor phocaeensis]
MHTTEKPLISVIVPVYNVGPYLTPCVDSLLGQTHQNMEILLIDDGSTDGSGAVCDGYAARDPRVRVFHQTNQGLSATRNVGLDAALGEYIAFVDADDRVAPDYLEVLLNDITENHTEMACCNYTYADDRGNPFYYPYPRVSAKRLIQNRSEFFSDILKRKDMYFSSVLGKLFCAKCIGNLRFPDLRCYYEDGWFMTDVFCQCQTAYLDDYAGYVYIQRDQSICAQGKKNPVIPQINNVRMWEHRYFTISENDAQMQTAFFIQYASQIHSLAYMAAISKNPEDRQSCRQFLQPHLRQVLARKNHLPARLCRRIVLYVKAPYLYNVLARFREKWKGYYRT